MEKNGVLQDLKKVLNDTADDVKKKIHKDHVKSGVEVTEKTVKECLDLISGAVKIVWPMGLPHFDTVRLELENCEDLSGTQVRESSYMLVTQIKFMI